MKKLNYIWVFSDSISGHEIQSVALASKISDNSELFHCAIRQPWLSFAPRILPRFGKNIIWKFQKPNLKNIPDAIITCGRRMAAIGKYYKRQLNCKHIQILNPKDNPKKYDIIICPEHDKLTADNVIVSKGSLHSITVARLLPYIKSNKKKNICLLLGNPQKSFYKDIDKLAEKISTHYPAHELVICGSRRTSERFHAQIRGVFSHARLCWLGENDGKNPYMGLLANSEIIMVTSDSINMVSEACATDKTVIALAQNHISAKHKVFIQTLQSRLSEFGTIHSNSIPIDVLSDVAQQVLFRTKKKII